VPHLHAEVVCAVAGSARGDRVREAHGHSLGRLPAHGPACRKHGVRLAINHQRRFNLPLLKAKQMIDALNRTPVAIEGAWHNSPTPARTCSTDVLFQRRHPAEWVLARSICAAQPRCSARSTRARPLRIPVSERRAAVYHFGYQHAELGCLLRLTGEQGVIEILFDAPGCASALRPRGWKVIDTGENIHDDKAIYAELRTSRLLDAGTVPQLARTRASRHRDYLCHPRIIATSWAGRSAAAAGKCAMLSMLAAGELKAKFST